MYHVYVLKSKKNNKNYVGLTSKSVYERLDQHNSGSNLYTKRNRPFELIYFEDYFDQTFARKRELFLKSGHGRKFLKESIPCSSVGRAVGCEKNAASSGNAS